MKKILYVFCGLIVLWAVAKFWPSPAYQPFEPDTDYKNRAAAYVKNAAALYDFPDGFAFKYFETSDGLKLRYGEVYHDTKNAKGTLIMTPGYSASIDFSGETTTEYFNNGYNVVLVDMRGQGGSDRMLKHNPEKPYVTDFMQYANDYAEFIGMIKQQQGGKIFVFGESMGGNIAMRTAAEALPKRGIEIDGLILSVPAVGMHTGEFPSWVARAIVDIPTALGFGKRFAFGSTNWTPWHPDMGESVCGSSVDRVHVKDAMFTDRQELRVADGTNRWFSEFMQSAEILQDADYLKRIQMPVLMYTAGQDVIVKTEIAQQACDDMLNCEMLFIEEAKHCLHTEDPKMLRGVWDTTLAFMDDQ